MPLRDLISALADDLDVGVVLTDGQLSPPGPHILYVNATFERMTGFNQDEILGKILGFFKGQPQVWRRASVWPAPCATASGTAPPW